MSRTPDITILLRRWEDEPEKAAQELLSAVYSELRRLGQVRMAAEAPGHTLQATALVHEAWLKMVDKDGRASFENRSHFCAAAAEAMRRILVDSARAKRRLKRGEGAEHVDIASVEIETPGARDDEMLEVHDALDALALHDLRKAQVVKLHYFIGLKFEEIAEVLNISLPTVNRDWAYARAWLHNTIKNRA